MVGEELDEPVDHAYVPDVLERHPCRLGGIVAGDERAVVEAAPQPPRPAQAVNGNGARPPSADVPSEAQLAIPGYDSLSAPQVVRRLDGLVDVELEAVRRYEEGHRGRRTILSKIAQLQADNP